jgi:putative pyruvate formate lyase activating enzyme
VYALDLPGVQRALGRYVKVVRDELPAKYLIAKKVKVQFDGKASEEKLWKIHERGLKEHRRLEKKIDEGKAKFEELAKPKQSLLDLKVELATHIMQHCCFCERRCGVNRLKGQRGFCRAGVEWRIFGAHAHHGEESCLVPSGTIFQAACSSACVYCCNAPESMNPELGEVWTIERVVEWIGNAKNAGWRNINWVGGDPTPWTWQILKALQLSEVNIAQVWNSNSYYSSETANLIDGLMDVYLLDFRYFSNECAKRLSNMPDYPKIAARNFLKANQAGELLIRVLIIPNHLRCDACPIIKWIKDNLGPDVRLNLLAQYHPYWKAHQYEDISKPLSYSEYAEVVKYAKEIGMKNLEKD